MWKPNRKTLQEYQAERELFKKLTTWPATKILTQLTTKGRITIMNNNRFVVALRNKINDKLVGFLKSYGFLDMTTVCIYATESFEEAKKCDEDYANSIPVDSRCQVLFGHLQDTLLDSYNVSITAIDETGNAPDFFGREYFDGKHRISRGIWQEHFRKLANECDWYRKPLENDIFYYKAEAEDTIWDDKGNYKPNFIYKPDGFRMCWYKYPLRSCFANRNIEFDEFSKMVDACVKSLKTQPLKECEVRY